MTVTWLGPNPNLGVVVEGHYFATAPLDAVYHLLPYGAVNPVTSLPLEIPDPFVVRFMALDFIPYNLTINNTTKILAGYITELDLWYPGFGQPEGFTYDGPQTAGQRYATYGSAEAEVIVVNFTIRAYNYLTYNPSNPTIDSYADRTFTLTIENNYSSDRDQFILEYFAGKTLTYNGEELTPSQWLVKLKQDGYYGD